MLVFISVVGRSFFPPEFVTPVYPMTYLLSSEKKVDVIDKSASF